MWRGARLPWAHFDVAAGGIRVGRRLCRGLFPSPGRPPLSRRPIRLLPPPASREFTRSPRRSRRPDSPADDGASRCDGRTPAGRRMYVKALRASCAMTWDAHRARDADLLKTAGGGRPTLADRPSLVCPPRDSGMGARHHLGRVNVRAADSASAAAGHALPAPRSRHVERQKRHPHLTPALSAPQGRRGRVGGAAASPLRPRGRGTGGGGARRVQTG